MATNGRRQIVEDDEDIIDVDDSSLQNNQANYAWEEEYKRSWDVLQEDEHGSLAGVVNSLQQKAKRKRLLRDTDPIQRGIIRHLFIVIDLSSAMQEKDLRPSRLSLTLTYLEAFIAEFFDQNPISQIGLIGTKDGLAEKLTDLSGNPTEHIRALKLKIQDMFGEPSLQNALELARNSLIHVPAHGSREILVIMGSLTTTDPGNIHDTIAQLVQDNIRASVIALAAEVQVLKLLTTQTKGTFGVTMNEGHYRDLLFEVIPPTAVTTTKAASNLVMMGFPSRSIITICFLLKISLKLSGRMPDQQQHVLVVRNRFRVFTRPVYNCKQQQMQEDINANYPRQKDQATYPTKAMTLQNGGSGSGSGSGGGGGRTGGSGGLTMNSTAPMVPSPLSSNTNAAGSSRMVR
ncbi:hypothetical protein BG004_006025 [Podila humilis]|nr:hypothetical protein BG004_006025 [Podila humilis]